MSLIPIEKPSSYGISVQQEPKGRKLFTVTYGLQVKSKLSYAQACKELGQCLFHALACEVLIDNSGE